MNIPTQSNAIVMTLDAGGTNFVFSAIQNGNEIVRPVHQPANAHDLTLCLEGMIGGFRAVVSQLGRPADAISFAFPGPADYKNGIIGDLGNLPAFRGGVALGPMLEQLFGIPVFINNDGDLFALGEASYGFLPWLNEVLREAGQPKRYANLIGVTLGTGFGGGMVAAGKLLEGDTDAAGEVWLLRNGINPKTYAEENTCARALVRGYNHRSGKTLALQAFDIYQIATGAANGDKQAALDAFDELGQALGEALADMITIVDGPVVIGGGLAASWKLFFPAMLKRLNGIYEEPAQSKVRRLESSVFGLENPTDLHAFLNSSSPRMIAVPFTDQTVRYDPVKKLGVGVSKLGTSRAVALGAYTFALQKLIDQ